MEQRNIEINKYWVVKPSITEREEHLFYRAVRTKVGAIYTPLACSSKVTAANSVTFYVIAACQYVTTPKIMQYVTVQYDVVDGTLSAPTINVVGPEKVEFKPVF